MCVCILIHTPLKLKSKDDFKYIFSEVIIGKQNLIIPKIQAQLKGVGRE